MTLRLARHGAAPVLVLLTLSSCASGRSPAFEPTSVPPRTVPASGTPFEDLLMTSAECTLAPRAAISKDDARVDLDVVARILKRGWSGYETRTAAGVDFDQALASVRAFVRDAPEPIPTEAFQDKLVTALAGAADNHLAFAWASPAGHRRRTSTGGHERAYTSELLVLNGKGHGRNIPGGAFVGCERNGRTVPLMPTLTSGLWAAERPIELSRTQPEPIHCFFRGASGVEGVDLPMRPLDAGTPDPTPRAYVRSTVRPVGATSSLEVVRMRSFSSSHATELTSFARDAVHLRQARSIVVDVRGNGGGSDDYARSWFENLSSGKLPYGTVRTQDSEVTRQGRVNDNLCALAAGIADTDARIEAVNRLDRARRRLAEAKADGNPRVRSEERILEDLGNAPAAFAGANVVLADRNCASACESFVSLARNLKGTVVVGSNTAGTAEFGEVLPYRLPKSGLLVQAGSKRFTGPTPARAFVEGRGILPDYWLDGADALTIATRLAWCLGHDNCPTELKSR